MKSILGAIITAVGYVLRPEVLNVLPEKVGAIVSAIGGILTVLGIRHAIAKSTQGK
jgi:hypothetical protein